MSYNRYINNFPNESEFTKYIGGNLADVPNTALIDDTGEMKYTKSLADYYVLYGTTTGSTDFMIGSSTITDYTPDCIQVHVVQKPDGNNEMYVKQDDVLKVPKTFYESYNGFGSDEGKKITSISKWNIDTSKVTKMNGMFFDCNGLTSVDLSNFNTSNVTSMSYMFSGCSTLKSLDLRTFDTTNCSDMCGLFSNCSNLESVDLSGFNTSNVTEMQNMFMSCYRLQYLYLYNFDTSKVTTMEKMFYNCSVMYQLNIQNFDTSNVTNMDDMFTGCNNIQFFNVGDKFFNSKTIQSYDFGGLINWTDSQTIDDFVSALPSGNGRRLNFSEGTSNAMTEDQKNQIHSKGWFL